MTSYTAVSFYTVGTFYEEEVKGLLQSLEKHEIHHDVRGLPNQGCFRHNVSMKAPFVRDRMEELDRPLLWIDADAIVRGPLPLFEDAPFDFAIYRRPREENPDYAFFAAIVFFNNTPGGKQILRRWARVVESRLDESDQITLFEVWDSMKSDIDTHFLDKRYARKIDWKEPRDALVIHKMASRKTYLAWSDANWDLKAPIGGSTKQRGRTMGS